jgi:hypothetical protein
MVSGSRACLTFILSDHPHRPSRHFDGALPFPLSPKAPRGISTAIHSSRPLLGLAAREEVKPVEWFRLLVLFVALVALVIIAIKL